MYVIELLKYTHIQIHRRYKNFFNVIFAIVEFSHRQIAYGLQLQFKIHSCCIFYITHILCYFFENGSVYIFRWFDDDLWVKAYGFLLIGLRLLLTI